MMQFSHLEYRFAHFGSCISEIVRDSERSLNDEPHTGEFDVVRTWLSRSGGAV